MMPLRTCCLALLLCLSTGVAAQTLPGATSPSPAARLNPEVHCAAATCTTTLRLQGTLEPGVVDQVREVVSVQPYPLTTVRLDSIGGTIRAAIDLARYVRAQRLDTEVGPVGRCLSACVYAFLGGVHRHVDPQGLLGIHAHRALPGTADDNPIAAQQIVRELLLHFQRMGAQEALAVAVLAVPPDRMCYLRASCLPLLGLTTDASPYLANRAACSAGASAWPDDAPENQAQVPQPTVCRAMDFTGQVPVDPGWDLGVGSGTPGP